MIYGQPQEVEDGVLFTVIGECGEEIIVMPRSVEWLSATYVRFIGSAAIKGGKEILRIKKGSQTTYEGDNTMRLVIDRDSQGEV